MTPENPGFSPEKRNNNEMREEVSSLTTYLSEIATKLDRQVALDKEQGVETSHETETLKTQVGMIQNRLIHCCGGKLRRERPNAIFHEIAEQMENTETIQVILSKVKKGIYDER